MMMNNVSLHFVGSYILETKIYHELNDRHFIIFFKNLLYCEIVYERMIDIVTPAHEMCSENYYVELHFLNALNYKILRREF